MRTCGKPTQSVEKVSEKLGGDILYAYASVNMLNYTPPSSQVKDVYHRSAD